MKHLMLFESWWWKNTVRKPKKPGIGFWDIESKSETTEVPNMFKLVKIPSEKQYVVKIHNNDQNVAFQYAFIELGFRDYYDREENTIWINIRKDKMFYYRVDSRTEKYYEAWDSKILIAEDTKRYDFDELFEPLEKYSGYHTGKNYGV